MDRANFGQEVFFGTEAKTANRYTGTNLDIARDISVPEGEERTDDLLFAVRLTHHRRHSFIWKPPVSMPHCTMILLLVL